MLHSKLADWLSVQETKYDYIIYEVDPDISNWTKLCLRQADKVILLGDNQDTATLNATEKYLFSQLKKIPTHIDLVVLYETHTVIPKNSNKWLLHRPLNIHHIKKETKSDTQRLIRILINKEIALVLGGGGAKSFAHIGVYKALEELNIPVDRLGGTSMGALIAASFAMGNSSAETINILEKNILFNRKCNDYTIPTIALMGGSGWVKAMKDSYGEDVYIEDLWKNFFCIASNFTTRKMNVLTKGLLYKAIRASVSLPGIVPPISNEHNELLIDGGVFNNLPVDIMRTVAPTSQIIAVRVSPFSDLKADIPDGIASGLRNFFHRFKLYAHPLPPKVPGIAEMIAGAITLCNDTNESLMLSQADYSLEMNLNKFGLLDFIKLPEIVDIGYRGAMEHFSKHPIKVP
ncbi:MAG: patatin-like phospholipase family protein [bacterium]|nr:patatin-like phospholipase family protein [bacterium]